MRLLVLSNLYPPQAVGGYESVCADTVEALSDEHEMLVLTSVRPHWFGPRTRETTASGVPVRRELPYVPHSPTASLCSPVSAVIGARVMERALDEFQPDALFVWNATEVPQAALWAAHRRGLPMAFFIAHPWLRWLYSGDRFARFLYDPQSGAKRWWAAIVRSVNRLTILQIETDRTLPASVAWVSHATREQSPAPAFMQTAQETVVYSSSPALTAFSKAQRRPEKDPPVIAFAGRLEPQKGPDIAIRALAELRDRHRLTVRLELAGTGETRYVNTLHSLASELGLDDMVRFRGHLTHPQLIDLHERASVFVVPSTWQEPSGMVTVEAALAMTPIVASLSGGMPELMRPKKEALYFPIGDWRACADAFASVLGDQAATETRVANARRRADDFTFGAYVDRIRDLIASLPAAQTAPQQKANTVADH